MKPKRIRAFTLPELMVVILILAILLAVAVPIYLAARNRAITRAGQMRLRNVTTAVKNLFTDVDMTFAQQQSDVTTNGNGSQLSQEAEPIVIQVGALPAGVTADVYITSVDSGGAGTDDDVMNLGTKDGNNTTHTATISGVGAVTIN